MEESIAMRPFMDEFKKIGEKEIRVVKVLTKESGQALPVDDYAFIEYYCDEKDCDCRRVMISVLGVKAQKIMATISMGFDSEEDDAGPYLDLLNTQSKYSEDALDLFSGDIGDALDVAPLQAVHLFLPFALFDVAAFFAALDFAALVVAFAAFFAALGFAAAVFAVFFAAFFAFPAAAGTTPSRR